MLALFAPNSIDTPVITWGTLWTGGIVSPTNPVYTVKELTFHLNDYGAKAPIIHVLVLPVANAAAENVGMLEDYIILLRDHHNLDHKIRHFTSIWNTTGMTTNRPSGLEPSQTCAFIVYLSGTTGPPKGVSLILSPMLSRQALEREVTLLGFLALLSHIWRVMKRNLEKGSFLHANTLPGLLRLLHAPLFTGCQVLAMEKFKIKKWCAYVQNYCIIFSYIVPPVVLLLTQHPAVNKYNFLSLQILNCNNALLTLKLIEAVYKCIHTAIKQGYGCTEVSLTSHNQSWEDWHSMIGSDPVKAATSE